MEWGGIRSLATMDMVLDRITFDEKILGGKACVRGMRIPVSVVLKLLAGDMAREKILEDYPDLELEDIHQCIHYAALLADERVMNKAS